MSADRVTKEELHKAGVIICQNGIETQLALQLMMTWFEEQLTDLRESIKTRNAQYELQIMQLQARLRRAELERNR